MAKNIKIDLRLHNLNINCTLFFILYLLKRRTTTTRFTNSEYLVDTSATEIEQFVVGTLKT